MAGRCRPPHLLLLARCLSYPSQPLTEALSLPEVARSPRPLVSTPTSITRLSNGLRVASQEAFGQYSTIGVLVDAGSRYEVDYVSGVSHFLQKLAFQSTAQFPTREELMSALEPYGGMFECQQFRDIMMYSLAVFSFGLPQAVSVMADAIWRPRLTAQEVDAERSSVAFQLETVQDAPLAEPLLMELIHQAAYRSNTLGLPSLCPSENIDKISVQQLKQFLAAHYLPSRMVLAGVNVNHEEFVRLAEEHFVNAPVSWEGIERPPLVDHSISQYTGGEMRVDRSGPPVVGPNPLPDLTHVVLALESSSYSQEESFFPFAVLNSLMGGGGSFSAGGPGKGMYTQLYLNVLTRHHWVYSALAQNHAYADSGIFCLLGSASPSQARELTEVLCQQFLQMTKLPNEVALARAKQQLKSAMMMNLESKLIVFEDIGRQVLGHDRKMDPSELSEKIDAVRGEDVQRVGQKLLESSPSLAVLGSVEKVPGLRDIEKALFNNNGHLPRKSRLFSF